MPVDSHGTDMEFIAVGIPLNLYPILLEELLNAFREHIKRFGDTHGIRDLLLNLALKINKNFDGDT